jgi:hypothetical protein
MPHKYNTRSKTATTTTITNAIPPMLQMLSNKANQKKSRKGKKKSSDTYPNIQQLGLLSTNDVQLIPKIRIPPQIKKPLPKKQHAEMYRQGKEREWEGFWNFIEEEEAKMNVDEEMVDIKEEMDVDEEIPKREPVDEEVEEVTIKKEEPSEEELSLLLLTTHLQSPPPTPERRNQTPMPKPLWPKRVRELREELPVPEAGVCLTGTKRRAAKDIGPLPKKKITGQYWKDLYGPGMDPKIPLPFARRDGTLWEKYKSQCQKATERIRNLEQRQHMIRKIRARWGNKLWKMSGTVNEEKQKEIEEMQKNLNIESAIDQTLGW